MGREFVLEREAPEQLVVRRNRSGIGGRRRRRCVENTAQNPVATLHRAGPQRRGSGGEHRAQTERAPALEGIGSIHLLGRVNGFHRRLDPVVGCEGLVHEGVVGAEDLMHRAIVPDDVFEKRNGLVVHGRFHRVGKFGEAARVHALELIEPVEAQPLAEEFRRHAARFGIGQHPLHLRLHLLRIGELTRRGGPAKLVVRNRRPEEEAHARG